MKYRSWSKSKTEKKPEHDAFTMVKVYLPNDTVKLLKRRSEEDQIPVSRLIAIAVDNELDTVKPFQYPCDTPDVPYQEYLYAKEAKAIIDFLMKFPHGTSIDTLMLCRRDIGIADRDTLMLALRELSAKKMIEEFAPSASVRNKVYSRIRVAGDLVKQPTKFKRIEGEDIKHLRRIKDEEISDAE
jgi:hypothetical protein